MSDKKPIAAPWDRVAFGKGGWRKSVRLAGRQLWWAPMTYVDAIRDSILALFFGMGSLLVLLVVTTIVLLTQIVAGLCGRLRDTTIEGVTP